jgi:hypothetical protein
LIAQPTPSEVVLLSSQEKTDKQQQPSDELLAIKLDWRHLPAPEITGGFKICGFKFSIRLVGLQILYDMRKWDSAYYYLFDRKAPKIETEKKPSEYTESVEKALHAVQEQLNQIRDLNDMRVSIEVGFVLFYMVANWNYKQGLQNCVYCTSPSDFASLSSSYQRLRNKGFASILWPYLFIK